MVKIKVFEHAHMVLSMIVVKHFFSLITDILGDMCLHICNDFKGNMHINEYINASI